jgi:hypothetical protein
VPPRASTASHVAEERRERHLARPVRRKRRGGTGRRARDRHTRGLAPATRLAHTLTRHRRLTAWLSVLAVLASTLVVTALVTAGARGMSQPTAGAEADAALVGGHSAPRPAASPTQAGDAAGLGATAGHLLGIAPPAALPSGGSGPRSGAGPGGNSTGLGAAAGGAVLPGQASRASQPSANRAPATTAKPPPVVPKPNPPARPAPPPQPPAKAPPPVNYAGTRSGLPWMSGVWTTGDRAGDEAFGAWRGRPLDLVQVYAGRDQGWSGITNPWPVSTYAGFPGRLVLSVPTFPQGGGSNAACASGAYDAHWRQLGSFLVAHGRADTIVRLGWEFNGTWMYWHSDNSGAAFKGCFQHAATAMRATDPKILLDWTFTAHGTQVPTSGNPYDAYPGNAYVDFIGIDSYDMAPASHSVAAFNAQCAGSNGMCKAIAFARANGKKLGVGEWGVASCTSSGGGGDNALYIQEMYNTFAANRDVMGYEAYFDDPDAGNVCSSIVNGRQNPQAAARYKALF